MSVANYLNELPDDDATFELTKCCASRAWVDGMRLSRPFASDEVVMQKAERVWWLLTEDDWREAFAAHPRIGDIESLRSKFSSTKDWAEEEQASVANATDKTLQRLADGNITYELKFGHIFIVFAPGKSAEQMLSNLDVRLQNDPEQEIRIAAAEQLKITQARLKKLGS